MKNLTNEELKTHFKNNFDLAGFAIAIAKEHLAGEEIPRLPELLKEIANRAEMESAS